MCIRSNFLKKIFQFSLKISKSYCNIEYYILIVGYLLFRWINKIYRPTNFMSYFRINKSITLENGLNFLGRD